MKSLVNVAAAIARGGVKNAMTALRRHLAVGIVHVIFSVAIAMVGAEVGVVDGNGHFLNNQSTLQKSSRQLMSMGKHDSI